MIKILESTFTYDDETFAPILKIVATIPIEFIKKDLPLEDVYLELGKQMYDALSNVKK